MHRDNKTISLLVEKGAQIQWYVVFDCEFIRKIKFNNRRAKKPFNKPKPNNLVNKSFDIIFLFFA